MKKYLIFILFLINMQFLYSQADRQADSVNLIVDMSGEEIVLQSADYLFETKFGKVKVDLSKKDNTLLSKLTLIPNMEDDLASMSDQASALLSSFSSSVETSTDVIATIDTILSTSTEGKEGSESDLVMSVAIASSDEDSSSALNMSITGDNIDISADVTVAINEDGSSSVAGSVTDTVSETSSDVTLSLSSDEDGTITVSGSVGGTEINTQISTNIQDVTYACGR